MAKQPPEIKLTTVDQQLREHLEKAEYHLIEAVKLFNRRAHPDRRTDYVERLIRAQEMVTTLFREELILKRGPIKVRVGK